MCELTTATCGLCVTTTTTTTGVAVYTDLSVVITAVAAVGADDYHYHLDEVIKVSEHCYLAFQWPLLWESGSSAAAASVDLCLESSLCVQSRACFDLFLYHSRLQLCLSDSVCLHRLPDY